MTSYCPVLLLFVSVLCSSQTEDEWKEWQKEHKKLYPDKHVEDYRKLLWMKNYMAVQKHNGNATNTYLLGLNIFADMVSLILDLQHASCL